MFCFARHKDIHLRYWFLQLLDKVTPSQWAAIGVLGSLVFGLLTYLTNLYFKIKEDKRKAARGE
ncbi:class II holin family protein [Escherichia coli]|nr:holin [Escherichia coli]EEQ2299425.1 holin [Escherichia coli]EEQ2725331.1 holin [Escherichia coli]EEX2151611.1 holin [Escherichia coli]EEX8905542.1 holin [Escherichia coli]